MNIVNMKAPYATWYGVFSPEELEAIDKYVIENIEPVNGVIGSGDAARMDDSVRKSSIYWIYYNEDTHWIFSRINAVGFKLNSHFFGFDINPLPRLQYTVYEDDGGHYNWHWDIFIDQGLNNLEMNFQRKFSIVVMCQEAEEGGNLELTWGSEAVAPEFKAGNAVVFPSFMLHRVAPVTKGIRKTLVGWFEGPDWR